MLLPNSTTIHLDVTLADLYQREGLRNLVYVPHYPSSCVDYGPSHPRNQKFYIDDDFPDSLPVDLSESQRQSLAVKATTCEMDRFKFFLGNIDVMKICSKECLPRPLNEDGPFGIPNRVDPSQIPKRVTNVFVDEANTDLYKTLEGLGRTIILPFPQDWCASLPHLVDPDLHYLFLSKTYLPRLPVDVPRQEIFQLDETLLIDLEVKSAPFVVKTTHGLGNAGTWIVTTEDERRRMLNALQKRHNTQSPSPIWSQKIIVTEFIAATHNYCVHFFVGHTGRSALLGATEQAVDHRGALRRTIKFKKQKALKAMFDGITASLGQALAADGYIGPVGADILIDGARKQWLIDLNPRINGGTPLCFMQQHLSVLRHLHHATLTTRVIFAGSIAKFTAAFQRYLHQGNIIVLSVSTSQCVGNGESRHRCIVICAARTKEGLEAIIDEIYDYCDTTMIS